MTDIHELIARSRKPIVGTADVIKANSRNLPLADDSVDLVVTSPPYFALRSYQDGGEHYAGQIGDEPTPAEFVASLLEVTRECVRVLKPSGSLWVNLGDKYARSGGGGRGSSDGTTGRGPRPASAAPDGVREKSLIGIPWRYALACIDDLGLILRAEVVWSKPNGLPESVTDRVRRSHEQWFHFTLEPRYFSAVDEIREQFAAAEKPTGAGWLNRTTGNVLGRETDAHGGLREQERNPLGKLPGSVWTVATEPLRVPDHLGIDHFAAFPTEWPRRIIKGWSPKDGVVLDPFGGTGTTAMVAKSLGRHGISVDMSSDYCRLAEWRTSDPYEMERCLAKSEGRKPMPRKKFHTIRGDDQ